MKKIFSLTYKDNTYGGPHQVSNDFKNILDKKDFHVNNEYFSNEIFFNFFFNKTRLKKVINEFDLIHIHMFFSVKSIIILKLASQLGIPTVVSLHGNLNNWSLKRNYLRKRIFLLLFKKIIKSISLIHFLNDTEKKEVSSSLDLSVQDSIILQNCIDFSKYKINRIKDSFFKILFFGRMDSKKSVLELLDVISIFKEKNINNIKFLFVGPKNQDYYLKVLDKVKRLELENLIEVRDVIDNIDEKNSLFEEIDIFILPSKDEADSISIKESLASGKPVIISDKCKVERKSETDEFIKVIYDKAPSSYYDEIIKFYNNREQLIFLAPKIRLYGKNNFSMDIIREQLPNIYHGCIDYSYVLNKIDE